MTEENEAVGVVVEVPTTQALIHKGLDVGTNLLIASSMDTEGNPIFKMQRDAFYRLVPKSEVNSNAIKNVVWIKEMLTIL